MGIKVLCRQCTKSFSAPDQLAGKRAKCPICGLEVPVPLPVARPLVSPALPAQMPTNAGDSHVGLTARRSPQQEGADPLATNSSFIEAELIDEPVATGLVASTMPDWPPSFGAAPLRTAPRRAVHSPPDDVLRRVGERKLIMVVMVVALVGILVDVTTLHSGLLTFCSLVGALIGGCAWGSQAMQGRRDAANWFWLERWIGIVAAFANSALSLVYVALLLYAICNHLLNVGWNDKMPLVLFGAILGLGVAFGISLALNAVFLRFGFYKSFSWIYVVVLGFLPGALWVASKSLGARMPTMSHRQWSPGSFMPGAGSPSAGPMPVPIGIPQPHTIASSPTRSSAASPRPRVPSAEKPRPAPAPRKVTTAQSTRPPLVVNTDSSASSPPSTPATSPAVSSATTPAATANPRSSVTVDLEAPAPSPPLRTKKPLVLRIWANRRIVAPTGQIVTPETPLTPGTEVQTEWGSSWYLAKVVELLPNDQVRIRWLDSSSHTEDLPRVALRIDLAKDPLSAEIEDPLEIAKTMRTWTDDHGRTTFAKFVDCKGNALRLRTADAKVITVPLDKLSISDQQIVDRILLAKGEK